MYNPWVNSSEFPLEQDGVKDGEIWAFDLARSIWVSAAAWLRPACLLAVIYGCVPVGGEGVSVLHKYSLWQLVMGKPQSNCNTKSRDC